MDHSSEEEYDDELDEEVQIEEMDLTIGLGSEEIPSEMNNTTGSNEGDKADSNEGGSSRGKETLDNSLDFITEYYNKVVIENSKHISMEPEPPSNSNSFVSVSEEITIDPESEIKMLNQEDKNQETRESPETSLMRKGQFQLIFGPMYYEIIQEYALKITFFLPSNQLQLHFNGI